MAATFLTNSRFFPRKGKRDAEAFRAHAAEAAGAWMTAMTLGKSARTVFLLPLSGEPKKTAVMVCDACGMAVHRPALNLKDFLSAPARRCAKAGVMNRKRIVVMGFMASCPIAGVIWQHVHYIVGLLRLGHEVWYVEDSARLPYNPTTYEINND